MILPAFGGPAAVRSHRAQPALKLEIARRVENALHLGPDTTPYLVADGGLAVALAEHGLDPAAAGLRCGVRDLSVVPAKAFPGNGPIRPGAPP